MTVLLVASQERVQDLFRSLQATELLQVHIVSSITGAEEEISGLEPDIAFIQSRISGLSGDIVLRHIQNLLPQRTQVVLLSNDELELQKARKHKNAAIDLAKGDDDLASDVRAILSQAAGGPPAAAPVGRKEPAPETPPRPEEPEPEEPEPEEPKPEEPEPEKEPEPEQPEPEEPEPEIPEHKEPEPEMPLPGEPKPEMAQAEAAQTPMSFESDRSDQSDGDIAGAEPSSSQEPPTFQQALNQKLQEQPPPASVGDLLAAQKPRLNRRKGGKILPIGIAAAVAAIAAAGAYTYLSSPPAAPPKAAQAPAKAPPPAKPRPHQEITKQPPATAPKQKPQTPHVLTLPSFIASAQQDDAYSSTHPGWERYTSADAEYKVFRQGSAIKAIQAMAEKGALSEKTFSWAKNEFAASGPYKLLSKETKGKYQIEKWQGGAGAGLTVYRKLPEQTMKALVLYYQ